jgi:hypothetical protein
MVLSIGLFFSLMIVGLAATLPSVMQAQLVAHGVPAARAAQAAHLPPVSSLFATFLGSNPIQTLLGPRVLSSLPPATAAYLTGTTFFPTLLSGPFIQGLRIAFGSSVVMCLVAAAASWLRGEKFVYQGVVPGEAASPAESVAEGVGA